MSHRRSAVEEATATAGSAAPRPLILHITADYPDANRAITTLAVRNLVLAADRADRLVVSLNRTALPWRTNLVEGDGHGDPHVVSMRYWGLPFGLGLALAMLIVARRIAALVEARGVRVSLIHAHKLTFEGIAAWWLSSRLGVPYVCSIRGEVEEKVMRFKPLYHALYARVLARCRHVFYVSAWFKPVLAARYRIPEARQSLLPNFVAVHDTPTGGPYDADRLVSVLHLDVYRKKGLHRLLPAFAAVRARHPGLGLDLIGRGTPETMAEVTALIGSHGLSDSVRVLGEMPSAALLSRLPGYAAMVLPSVNETFGMVYVEALLAGVPVLYSRGTGIDGYLDGIEAALPVDPQSVESISAALQVLVERQVPLRRWIAEHRAEIRNRFDRGRHIEDYYAVIEAALTPATPGAASLSVRRRAR